MTEEKDIFEELSPEAQEELSNNKAEKEADNEQ